MTHVCCDPLYGSIDTDKLRFVLENRGAWRQHIVSLAWLMASKQQGSRVDEAAFSPAFQPDVQVRMHSRVSETGGLWSCGDLSSASLWILIGAR